MYLPIPQAAKQVLVVYMYSLDIQGLLRFGMTGGPQNIPIKHRSPQKVWLDV